MSLFSFSVANNPFNIESKRFSLKVSIFCRLFEICRRNTTASTEKFTEKLLGRDFALLFTSYLSIALSKIMRHSETIKNSKKLSVFGENDSR